MNQSLRNVHELTVAYIGGGSRGWAWGFMKDLALDGEICGTVRLYDIDREAAERNRIIGEKISAHQDAASRWAYEVSDSLQEALTGADFVVISILPGTFDEMESDVHLPERLGIWQPVGDTVGAGGFMRAARRLSRPPRTFRGLDGGVRRGQVEAVGRQDLHPRRDVQGQDNPRYWTLACN